MGQAYKRNIDSASIERANYYALETIKYTVERAERYKSDPCKQARLQASECIVCYRAGRIGCAAITQVDCGICGVEMSFPSTNVDVVCFHCALNNNLCKHCGADIELKSRRKLRAFEIKTNQP